MKELRAIEKIMKTRIDVGAGIPWEPVPGQEKQKSGRGRGGKGGGPRGNAGGGKPGGNGGGNRRWSNNKPSRSSRAA